MSKDRLNYRDPAPARLRLEEMRASLQILGNPQSYAPADESLYRADARRHAIEVVKSPLVREIVEDLIKGSTEEDPNKRNLANASLVELEAARRDVVRDLQRFPEAVIPPSISSPIVPEEKTSVPPSGTVFQR